VSLRRVRFTLSVPLIFIWRSLCEGATLCRSFFQESDMSIRSVLAVIGTLVLAAGTQGALAQAVDASAAEALAKKSGCLKCHSIAQKKDAPAFRDVAAKYKGKADAEKTLYTHLTTNPKVKVDGKEEEHDSLKTKNADDVRNVVRWILSR
jgi:cytochrome c